MKRPMEEQGAGNSTMYSYAGAGNRSVVVEHIRVNKEFKLGGTVGDGKNCLGYGTIYYRMLEGLNNGFKQKEVISGVVRAMQGGSELSQWFERHPELEWDEFLGILRNHYQLENYGQMLMNYGKEFQKTTKEAIDFAYRMTRLRDDIVAVAAHEGAVVERKMVQELCLHGLSKGLCSKTIRMELRPALSNVNIPDQMLFKEVKAAAKREQEYLEVQREQEAQAKAVSATKKKSGNPTPASVASVSDTDRNANLAILEQLQKLTTSNEQMTAQMKKRDDEMEKMKNDLDRFQKKLDGKDGFFRTRAVLKCPACQVSGKYCRHCAHCGKDDHKMRECPEKN